MSRFPLRLRLTIWYFISLTLILGVFVGFSWLAMKRSMYAAIDQDLRYRITAIESFVATQPMGAEGSLAFPNATNSSLGATIIQVTNDKQEILYESKALSSHGIQSLPPAPLDGSLQYQTSGSSGWPVRVVSRRSILHGTVMTIHVAEPLRTLLTSLRRYSIALALALPFILAVGTAAGYWISARALAPVEQLRMDAEAIGVADLSARVSMPSRQDELGRLATTLNAMLARIEGGYRTVQQFTADASHELRSPLTLIQAAADYSLRRQRTSEELVDAHRKILSAAQHMTKIVESLLLLAREDANATAYDLELVDLKALLQRITSDLSIEAKAKGVSLECLLPEHPVQLLGNSVALHRLFVILIDNAIKYTEEGSVTVRLVAQAGELEILVCDTGIGISDDALPHLFERFWRADSVRSRNGTGAGLGLSLAKQIADRHDAVITVQSKLGEGSRFSVTFHGTSAA